MDSATLVYPPLTPPLKVDGNRMSLLAGCAQAAAAPHFNAAAKRVFGKAGVALAA